MGSQTSVPFGRRSVPSVVGPGVLRTLPSAATGCRRRASCESGRAGGGVGRGACGRRGEERGGGACCSLGCRKHRPTREHHDKHTHLLAP